MVDNLTKYVSLFAVKSTTADELIESVKIFVGAFGLPGRLVTDRGSCYTSGVFERFCVEQGIRLVLTSSRHPQANGQVERTHSVVMSTLITMNIQPNAWDESLSEVQRILNNSETKVSAKTPFEMLHGFRPRFKQGALRELSTTVNDWSPPEYLRREVLPLMEKAKEDMKKRYDTKRHDNSRYVVGEVVVMKRAPSCTGESTKLQDRYRGPLVINEVLPGNVYRVMELDTEKKSRFATTAHVSQLKSWRLVDAEGEGDEPGVEEKSESETEGPNVVPGEVRSRPTRTRRKPVRLQDYVN